MARAKDPHHQRAKVGTRTPLTIFSVYTDVFACIIYLSLSIYRYTTELNACDELCSGGVEG